MKTNGDFTLMVTSGIDKEGAFYGIPYGSFPRLTLAYIITEVIETKERRIELSAHFGGSSKKLAIRVISGEISDLQRRCKASCYDC